jgi:hypothetical protein
LTPPDEPQPDFLIRLRPTAADRVVIHDLRRLLKALLRGFRLRCVSAVEVPRQAEAEPK